MKFENKNEKQVFFNYIKGILIEIIEGEQFCSLTLEVGHETKRKVNFCFKKDSLEDIKANIAIGDKANVRYYPSSYNKYDKWKTILHLLSVEKITIIAES